MGNLLDLIKILNMKAYKLIAILIYINIIQAHGQSPLTIDLNSPLRNGYNVSCFGGRDGMIDLTITGGMPPYNIRWSNEQTTEDLYGLAAGYYKVSVYDATNNGLSMDITLNEPEPFEPGIELWKYTYPNEYNTSCFNCFDGIITLSSTRGISPLTFLWNDGATNQDRTNIDEGEYTVTVSDANGCTVRASITLNAPGRDVIVPDPPSLPCTGSSIVAWQQNPAFPDYIFSCWNRFGIGTDMPQERLDVKGFGKFAAYNTSSSFIRLGHDGIDANGQNGNARLDNYGNGDLLINYGNPKNVKMCLGNNSGNVETGGNTFLATWGGKVGIGILTPYEKFQIGSDWTFHDGISKVISRNAYSTATGHMRILNGNSSNITFDDQGAIIFNTAPTDVAGTLIHYNSIIIDNNGSMGIGLNPQPGYKLVVDGQLGARSIKVTLQNWPDYVFETDYSLPHLEDRISYLKVNKHLPGVTEAAEIETSGVELGGTISALTKNIEELYLYIEMLNDKIKLLESKQN